MTRSFVAIPRVFGRLCMQALRARMNAPPLDLVFGALALKAVSRSEYLAILIDSLREGPSRDGWLVSFRPSLHPDGYAIEL